MTAERDAARLARALIGSNHAVRKVIEALRFAVALPDDDPLARGLADAETALNASDNLADRIARGEPEGGNAT